MQRMCAFPRAAMGSSFYKVVASQHSFQPSHLTEVFLSICAVSDVFNYTFWFEYWVTWGVSSEGMQQLLLKLGICSILLESVRVDTVRLPEIQQKQQSRSSLIKTFLAKKRLCAQHTCRVGMSVYHIHSECIHWFCARATWHWTLPTPT